MDKYALDANKIIQSLAWPLFIFILILFLAILFREQIKKLFPRITEIVFDPRNRNFKIAFGEKVKQAKAQANGIEENVAASGVMPAAEQKHEYANLMARDIVLEAWGALKQTIYNACSALQIPMTPATGIQVAADRLFDANAIDESFANLIMLLHNLGQDLANDTNHRPIEEDARVYKDLSDIMVDWMMLNILSPSQGKSAEAHPKPPRRATAVGGYYPQTKSGKPAATLMGIGGSVQDERYTINKELFKIGRNEDNDVCLKEDEYVSGSHAFLSFKDGNLFLSDQNSHNGTFLNEEQVGTPLMVRPGDQIRVGEAVFQVT